MKDAITINGENIVLGETELPIQQIRSVEVLSAIPRRLLLFGFVGLAIFIIGTISMMGLALYSILSGNADNASTSSILGAVFSLTVVLTFSIVIFATLTYPIEWRVQIVTLKGSCVVFVDRSRTRATIYANRVRRIIQQASLT